MELTAAIEALKALTKPCRVALYGFHLRAERNHRVVAGVARAAGGRRTEAGEESGPVADAVQLGGHEVEWHWVKGHSGHPENKGGDGGRGGGGGGGAGGHSTGILLTSGRQPAIVVETSNREG
jgi:hypothetical protein